MKGTRIFVYTNIYIELKFIYASENKMDKPHMNWCGLRIQINKHPTRLHARTRNGRRRPLTAIAATAISSACLRRLARQTAGKRAEQENLAHELAQFVYRPIRASASPPKQEAWSSHSC
jgi:hypothetical protein